jgi:hypothetical protein
MSEEDREKQKYQVEIDNAQGVVIGDYASVEQHFHNVEPSLPPVSRKEMLAAMHRASTELRTYPNDVANIPDTHIDRIEVTQIVEWGQHADIKDRLGMLLDQPGGGKTVVTLFTKSHTFFC